MLTKFKHYGFSFDSEKINNKLNFMNSIRWSYCEFWFLQTTFKTLLVVSNIFSKVSIFQLVFYKCFKTILEQNSINMLDEKLRLQKVRWWPF